MKEKEKITNWKRVRQVRTGNAGYSLQLIIWFRSKAWPSKCVLPASRFVSCSFYGMLYRKLEATSDTFRHRMYLHSDADADSHSHSHTQPIQPFPLCLSLSSLLPTLLHFIASFTFKLAIKFKSSSCVIGMARRLRAGFITTTLSQALLATASYVIKLLFEPALKR